MSFNLGKFKKNNLPLGSEAGFTILEVIVSVSIIAMISGIFIVNYRYAGQNSKLVLAAQQMASDIRLAQNNSLGTAKFNDTQAEAKSWGIYFNNTESEKGSYIIFADIDSSKTYESPAELYRTVILPTDIIITEIIIKGGTYVDAAITFLPPNPRTFIKPFGEPADEHATAEITLKNTNNDQTKTVLVNFFGLIDVN